MLAYNKLRKFAQTAGGTNTRGARICPFAKRYVLKGI